MSDTFSILIPKHCSALSGRSISQCPSLASRLSLQENPGRKRRRPSGNNEVGVLIVQCHLDRLVWNAFLPLLIHASKGNDGPLLNACEVLKRHYRPHIQRAALLASDGLARGKEPGEEEKSGESSDLLCYNFFEQLVTKRSKSLRNRRRMLRHTLMIILPPYPHAKCTSPATLEPERWFTSRLVRLENIMVRLQSLNAFFSTLGGGYFLCRYLTTAVQLARWQRAVALSLGDRNLAARCTVNEAYNYIHSGRLEYAFLLLQKVKADAIARGDELTVSMCKSARYFGKRVQKMQVFEGCKQGVDDELQRIRIVRDDSKINRTFRPLHEL